MKVPLTAFIDYLAATGTSRLTRVRNAKKQIEEGYAPERDFYRPLRLRIIDVFETGWDPKRFDELLAEVDDAKKQDLYANCRKGLRKWAGVSGKKTYPWRAPGKGTWKSGDLEVNVNPELWIELDGELHAIKIYFRSEALSQAKANLALEVIQKTVGKKAKAGVLDLQQGKLFVQTTDPPDGIDFLLASEAAGFAHLWDLLS